MGKNGRFMKSYGRVVGKDNEDRPGWKGPGFTKKAEPKPKKAKQEVEKDTAPSGPVVPVELQQLLLNIFRDTYLELLESEEYRQLLQDVKGALYERDFSRAFGKEEYLEVYSARWSPSRSLCYVSILLDLRKHLGDFFLREGSSDLAVDSQTLGAVSMSAPSPKPRVVSFGGGAAEVIAFGGFLKSMVQSPQPTSSSDNIDDTMASLALSDSESQINLVLVDTAHWGNVVTKLQGGLTTPPVLSKYASAATREANAALLTAGELDIDFIEKDALAMSQVELGDLFGKVPLLVTLFFTLNELYTASMGKTTAFLLNITSALPSGSLLLVVDSPGSYSETKVGTEEKKYPMKWLLDHTLIEAQKTKGQDSKVEWVKVHSEDSQWFRLPEELRYPIPLENMRYQVHLYRRS